MRPRSVQVSEAQPGNEATGSGQDLGSVVSPGVSSSAFRVAPVSPVEQRLYDVQRSVLYGSADADRPVTVEQVCALAQRHGAGSISVVVDNDGLDPFGAVATPAERVLRFHEGALTLWVAIHEVTHLLPEVGVGHGPAFVSAMAGLLDSECGGRCGDRFRAGLISHAVPRLPARRDKGVFVLEVAGQFVAAKKSVGVGHATDASRMFSRSAAARAADRAQRRLCREVHVVQLA